MTILADPCPPAQPPLHLCLADLGEDVGRLTGTTLYLDVNSPLGDQLWAIAGAAEFLRSGTAPAGAVRPRHLKVVR